MAQRLRSPGIRRDMAELKNQSVGGDTLLEPLQRVRNPVVRGPCQRVPDEFNGVVVARVPSDEIVLEVGQMLQHVNRLGVADSVLRVTSRHGGSARP